MHGRCACGRSPSAEACRWNMSLFPDHTKTRRCQAHPRIFVTGAPQLLDHTLLVQIRPGFACPWHVWHGKRLIKISGAIGCLTYLFPPEYLFHCLFYLFFVPSLFPKASCDILRRIAMICSLAYVRCDVVQAWIAQV